MDDNECLNDFVLSNEDADIGKRHAMIKFYPIKRRYRIKDLSQGTGTFARIDREIFLKDANIISFSDTHMIVNIYKEDNTVVVKFVEGPMSDQLFQFSPEDSPIYVGRMAECKIRFNDSSLSRF